MGWGKDVLNLSFSPSTSNCFAPVIFLLAGITCRLGMQPEESQLRKKQLKWGRGGQQCKICFQHPLLPSHVAI